MRVLMGVWPWDKEIVRRGVRFKLKRRMQLTDGMDVVNENEIANMNDNERMRMIDQRLNEQHQHEWDNSVKGRVLYEFVRSVTFARENEWFDPGWGLSFLITGHGSMNAFLYERGLSETEQCICGRANETNKHLLFECGLYDGMREWNKWAIVRVGAWDTWELQNLVTDQRSYETINEYGQRLFELRKGLLRGMNAV